MGTRLSKAERLRAERRGFKQFIDAERDRRERGVYSEDIEDHVEATIAKYEQKIEEINEEVGEGNEEQLLDEEREEIDETDEYEDDEEAQEEGFATAEDGNAHFREMREELNWYGNLGARVECQVVQDVASEGITKKDLYAVADEYEKLHDEVCRMFGVNA